MVDNAARPTQIVVMADITSAGGHLTIDLAALTANYVRFAALAAPAACGAVVKADAYGLGAARIVPALVAARCRHFFVVHLDEAAAIAPLLPTDADLYVLNGLYPGSEAGYAAARAMPVLNSLEQVRRWSAHAHEVGRPLPAAIQVDSGMSRLGLPAAEIAALAADGAFARWIEPRLVMSHLACAEQSGDPANARQLDAFLRAAALFPGVPRSLANSGGTVLGGPFRGDVVRIGIALYGGNPSAEPGFAPAPVVRLEARVIQVRAVPAGTGVGYGLTHVTRRPSRIATLGVGYADGWPRALSDRGAAFFGGRRLPIVGRVSMDSMTADMTDLGTAGPGEGDWVELIGPHHDIDAVARDAGTIGYEILTRLGRRYHVTVAGQGGAA